MRKAGENVEYYKRLLTVIAGATVTGLIYFYYYCYKKYNIKESEKYYLNALAADENTTDKITNSLSVFNGVCKIRL
ncbi:hypothetical protein ATZ36_02870 [Candidatus Endomicrobiellum trichonymphae]|jgi:hypothetical protein|uniref:Uncharacterized protein n=1 Tax=Endomicrobium trichonymphae TaxID=1408204 RepID=A0A1E5IKX4_ENDTX|nr:hypothetical protein ATZ36_02870 [Candidatus Endomicrobium trichonymphae]